jgi:hypothetical protein
VNVKWLQLRAGCEELQRWAELELCAQLELWAELRFWVAQRFQRCDDRLVMCMGFTGCGKTHDTYQAMPSGIA